MESAAIKKTSSAHEPPAAANDAAPRPPFWQGVRRRLWHLFRPGQDSSLKEVIEEVIEEHGEEAEEPMAPAEKTMLRNVLGFGDIVVSDIMVPRADISAVPHDISLDALKKHILEQRHTRVPVYEGTLDKMLGFIHIKDLFAMVSGGASYNLRSVMRNLLFVPPSMKIIDLLVGMRQVGSHMAIVIDEYGGADGLVTMENLFEQIVGDIQDEHDQDEDNSEKILRVSDKVYETSARIPIERLEKALGVRLSGEDEENREYDTLGGLIFFQAGRIPARGEIIAHPPGLKFEILEADLRRIRKVRIVKG